MEKLKFSLVSKISVFFVSLLVVIFGVSFVSAASNQKLTASDFNNADRFGDVVEVSGSYAVVGSSLDDDKGTDSGSVYVYYWTGSVWKQHAKLTANDGSQNDKFGYSVAISGNTIVVGAPFDDNKAGVDTGAIYVFEKDSTNKWIQKNKFTPSDVLAYDNFGFSVDVDGNYIVAGAYLSDVNGNDSGSAYVYNKSLNNWSLQKKLTASNAAWGDMFGQSVAISGQSIVVGAPKASKTYYDDWGLAKLVNSGAVYHFVLANSNWSEKQVILASDAKANTIFGYSVDVNANTLVVGAPYDGNGSAYIFAKNRTGLFSEEKKIVSPMVGRYSYKGFGLDVSVSGDYVAVSSENKSSVLNTGSVNIYKKVLNNWSLKKQLISDSTSADAFGYSVALYNNSILVGAPQSSATYLYSF